jgi:hypothetical protein
MPTLAEVAGFLDRFKKRARTELCISNRKKNRNELALTGLMPWERHEAIMDLEPEDYCEGPKPDDDGTPGEVWLFGKVVGGRNIYIKLKLSDQAKCISFHAAEHEMKFPFKVR